MAGMSDNFGELSSVIGAKIPSLAESTEKSDSIDAISSHSFTALLPHLGFENNVCGAWGQHGLLQNSTTLVQCGNRVPPTANGGTSLKRIPTPQVDPKYSNPDPCARALEFDFELIQKGMPRREIRGVSPNRMARRNVPKCILILLRVSRVLRHISRRTSGGGHYGRHPPFPTGDREIAGTHTQNEHLP